MGMENKSRKRREMDRGGFALVASTSEQALYEAVNFAR